MPTIQLAIHWLQSVAQLLPWAGVILLIAMIFMAAANMLLRIGDRRWQLKQKPVFLELTPPAHTDKSRAATQHLFSVLHGLEATRSWKDKLLRHSVAFSLEIVSSREQGIRYIMRVLESEADTFEHSIVSYLPNVRFKRVDDYLPHDLQGRITRTIEFKQTGYFAYPLLTQGVLEEHDPIAYLTGSMTKLAPNELIVFQIVASPTKVREAELLSKRLMGNEELVYALGRRRVPVARFLLDGINTVLFGILDGIGDLTSSGAGRTVSQRDYYRKHDIAIKARPARVLSSSEQDLAQSVQNKLAQPLFRTNIRTIVAMEDRQTAKQRIKSISEALALFKVPKYQSLRARSRALGKLQMKHQLFTLRNRLPSLWRGGANVLAASEIADLYHFPYSDTTKTENVVKSLSKTLPAPISLKGKTEFDVVLGQNHHHGTLTNIGLTAAERERHVYIIGGTGNGKTTMLEYGIVQDIQNGKGVAVIDPHGDLAEKLLRYIPEERINDVIYFNPSDLQYPIGLNLLELPEGLSEDELLNARDFITESVISIMRKTFSKDDSGGHRIEYILRNSVHTALTVKDATLFTVYDLLTDTTYRNKITRTLKDQKLKNFWKNEFGKAGGFQQVKMAAGVTAKIGRYQFSASAGRILSQPKSTINFEEILDGKILICNLAKGLVGEDTSELFGISILAKLQLAAYRRVKQQRENRRPFHIYVDEFQNFATMSFIQMLSEARKYRVFLTMAEQSTSQQEEQQMVNTILANVGTVICFRSGNPADEELLLPLFKAYVDEGEIANLPSYNFYMRIAAIKTQEPFSGETILLEDIGSQDIAHRVVDASRKNNTRAFVPEVKKQGKVPPKKERGTLLNISAAIK